MKRFLLVLLVLLSPLGLATASLAEKLPSDLELFPKVAGKSPEEVEKIMGKPGKVKEEGGKIHWYYEQCVVSNGEVTDWKLTFTDGECTDAGTGKYF